MSEYSQYTVNIYRYNIIGLFEIYNTDRDDIKSLAGVI